MPLSEHSAMERELLSGEIITLSDAQSLIWEKAEKEFKALREKMSIFMENTADNTLEISI